VNGSTTLEEFTYLGLGSVVKRAHPESGVDLTYIGSSAGSMGYKYVGLDLFGRIVDQRWANSGTDLDRFAYGYDRDSNRLWKENLVVSAASELYSYDGLNQLESFRRGTLNSSHDTISNPTRQQGWSFDSAGNFTSVSTDGTPESRTHNAQNQVTGVGSATLTFDANGNTTSDDGNRTLVYDAWNRLVAVGSTAAYVVDALGRRIQETRGETTRDLYYSAAWQVIDEKEGGDWKARQVWSPVYVDALVLRDRDANSYSGDGLEERLYVAQDANWNVTALINSSGAAVERIVYDPYGKPTFMDSAGADRMPNASSFDWVYLHQGLRLDSIVDLYDNRARAYSATLMRFLQNDPIGFAAGTPNTMARESNQPTNYLDPSGLQVITDPFCKKPKTIAEGGSVLDGLPDFPGPKLSAQELTINFLKNKIYGCKCCPPEQRRKAAEVLEKLIKLTHFDWAGRPLGPLGDCDKWVDEYLRRVPYSDVSQDLHGVRDCLTLEGGVAFDNHALQKGGPIAGAGVCGILGLKFGPIGLGIGAVAGGIAGYVGLGSAGHNAVSIKLCDGTRIYLDDGNYGGETHMFFYIAGYYSDPRPVVK